MTRTRKYPKSRLSKLKRGGDLWEGEAPAEPLSRCATNLSKRLSRSFALPMIDPVVAYDSRQHPEVRNSAYAEPTSLHLRQQEVTQREVVERHVRPVPQCDSLRTRGENRDRLHAPAW